MDSERAMRSRASKSRPDQARSRESKSGSRESRRPTSTGSRRRWRWVCSKACRCPATMRRREVEANLGIFSIWKVDEQLAARDGELFRRQMLLDGAFRLVAVLSAINRLYFSAFQFKRAAEHFSRLSLKPDRLAERLDFVANAAPSEAAEELRRLVEETKAIVGAELPDVDVEVSWQPLRDHKP